MMQQQQGSGDKQLTPLSPHEAQDPQDAAHLQVLIQAQANLLARNQDLINAYIAQHAMDPAHGTLSMFSAHL